jgi:hypothetical protein
MFLVVTDIHFWLKKFKCYNVRVHFLILRTGNCQEKQVGLHVKLSLKLSCVKENRNVSVNFLFRKILS